MIWQDISIVKPPIDGTVFLLWSQTLGYVTGYYKDGKLIDAFGHEKLAEMFVKWYWYPIQPFLEQPPSEPSQAGEGL